MSERSVAPSDELARQNRERIDHAPPKRVSPWTRKQLVIRVLWHVLGGIVWRLLPPARSSVLRLFGGKVGRDCQFGARVDILIPWNLRIGDCVEIGDRTILYALGPIDIGDDCILDYRAHLCAGTHDFSDPGFPQTRPGIRIGTGTFIGIDAYIGPGVTLGAKCRVHPRASVYRNFEDGAEIRGNPARQVTTDREEAVNG